MKSYCIFKVYDYKGGELNSSTNLDYECFIAELSELFENALYDIREDKQTVRDNKIEVIVDDKPYIDIVKAAILKELKGDFYSTYAGGDGFCGKCFVVENNHLSPVNISSYVDDIAKYINENWD
jgi:hypothetical protein